ncbi:hypothetical protein [Flavobacterium sp. NRK F7]|uniref:hypothetical protein n=1 Tax=Flavobacterium sp. NRK F7 TaxID=2954930 RepID=UPI0020912E1D|nr:hypothetical protein [Flavobacterium sp. NRK F7]MCO6162581.1 hypothetical protein [Flavobacterium sp. NRK F7]
MSESKLKLLVTNDELKRRKSLSLDEKITWTLERYIDYFEAYKGCVYLSFSGGKDSQVLDDIITNLHDGLLDKYLNFEYLFLKNYLKINSLSKPPKVFCDTGLEFPDIRKHVKGFKNVIWLKPKMKWTDVINNVGFLIGSKKTSRMIKDLRNPTDRNKKSRTLYLSGIKSDGTISNSFKLANRWKPLINAPFKVSDKCCDIFKKEPFRRYEKISKRKPITATTTEEGDMRRISYLKTGCNSFGENPMSRPISIWTENDIWAYHNKFNLNFAPIYYSREVEFIENDGTLSKIRVEPEKRSGCIFCLIGSPKQIEKRFDRLKYTHQKIYNHLMDKTGFRFVFEFIGIKSKIF